MKRTTLVLVAVALLLSVVEQAKADLIVNGSFEAPNVAPGDFGLYANGSVPGWTSKNNEIEIDHTTILGLPYYDGPSQSLEVNGIPFDTISQTVVGLAPGARYRLSYGYGDRPGSGPQQLNVFFGGALVGIDIGSGSGVWTPRSFTVTATSASETLSFTAVDTTARGGDPGVGNEVDGVSLNAVPEPASLALLALGFAGIGCYGWRRRSRIVTA